MTGQSECTHASYDLVMKMMTDNCVHYLPPSKFITREAELRHDKPQKELNVQGSSIIVKPKEPDQSCDTSTALSLHHALQRRSLALDVVGATDYFRVQAFSDFLMSHLHEPATQGFKPTTVQQVLTADRAAWVRLQSLLWMAFAQTVPATFRLTPSGPNLKMIRRLSSICCRKHPQATQRPVQPSAAQTKMSWSADHMHTGHWLGCARTSLLSLRCAD